MQKFTVKEQKGIVLASNAHYVFEKGEYHIYPTDCEKAYYAFSNNDRGDKDIWLRFKDLTNVTVDGSGSTLVLHGRITPFVIDGCDNVTVKGFTVEYSDVYHMEADLVRCTEDTLVLSTENYSARYEISDDTLKIIGENVEVRFDNGSGILQEYSRSTAAPLYNGLLTLFKIGTTPPEGKACMPVNLFRIEETDIGFNLTSKGIGKHLHEGSMVVLTVEKRISQCMGITGSSNVCVEDIVVYNTPGMGFITQVSRDITFRRVKVMRKPGSRLIVSTLADATHFVNCYGHIRLEDCVLEHMMDDGTNIHGVYTEIASVDGDKVTVKLMHSQQAGLLPYSVGDVVRVYRGNTIIKVGEYTVTAVEMTSDESIVLGLEGPEGITVGDHVESVTKTPDVTIERVSTGYNRPRGFLINAGGHVEIRGCTFNNSAQGILIAGDTTFWFESGAVNDVLIEDNVFEDCCYLYGEHPIAIVPEYERTEGSYYHSNITVRNNLFKGFTGSVLCATDVKGINAYGNVIEASTNYKKRGDHPVYEIKNSTDVTIKE